MFFIFIIVISYISETYWLKQDFNYNIIILEAFIFRRVYYS